MESGMFQPQRGLDFLQRKQDPIWLSIIERRNKGIVYSLNAGSKFNPIKFTRIKSKLLCYQRNIFRTCAYPICYL